MFGELAALSLCISVLSLAVPVFVLQVYDRVVPTQGRQTLFFLTLVLLFGLATLALHNRPTGAPRGVGRRAAYSRITPRHRCATVRPLPRA